jgi:hypothetical protein
MCTGAARRLLLYSTSGEYRKLYFCNKRFMRRSESHFGDVLGQVSNIATIKFCIQHALVLRYPQVLIDEFETSPGIKQVKRQRLFSR